MDRTLIYVEWHRVENRNMTLRDREASQVVEGLTHGHKDPTLDPRHQCKKWSTVAHSCKHSDGNMELGGAPELTDHTL